MMQRRKSFFLIVAVVIILVAGFFTYSQYHDKTTQQDNVVKKNTQKSPDTPKPANEQPQPANQQNDTAVKKSPVPESNPQQGEIFVQGKVKSVDAEKRIITITQLMDDNSKPVNPNVPISKDAVIQDKNSDIAITQIKNGDNVGLIITSDGQARAVLVNY